MKPADSANANGIFITSKLSEIPKKEEFLVQEYILYPLLVHNKKFKIRTYVTVTSLVPLRYVALRKYLQHDRIYIHNEGFLYFSLSDYDPSPENFSDKFIHISGGNAKDFDSLPPWLLSEFKDYLKSQGMFLNARSK